MPQSYDPRDGRTAPRSHSARLGPYETAYDTRRGYTETDGPAERPMRHDEDEVWRGRGRDER
jgi:hypothetical protein